MISNTDNAELIELRLEVARQRAELAALRASLAAETARADGLRKALEFYANENHWMRFEEDGDSQLLVANGPHFDGTSNGWVEAYAALAAYRASAAPEAGGGLLYTQMTFWLGHVTGTGGTSALHYWPSICGTCKEIAEFLAVYRADAIAARANETFCCQSAEKMYELTDPSAPLPQSFGGTCATCGGDEPYSYHVPENLWRVIVPEKLWGEIVCAKCFHGFAISKVNQ